MESVEQPGLWRRTALRQHHQIGGGLFTFQMRQNSLDHRRVFNASDDLDVPRAPFASLDIDNVGIDWADTKHDVCIQSGIEGKREFALIPHQPSDIDEWVQSLLRRFTAPIAIAVELSKGPIVYALQQYNGLVIFPVTPSTLAKYRQAFKPSRAKDDPTDAELAVDLIVRHPERFKPLRPQSTEMRMLASLVEDKGTWWVIESVSPTAYETP